MSAPKPGASGGVSPPMALGFAVVGFLALVIAGFGMASLLLDADVIAVSGLGQLPGVIAVAAATAAFGGVLWAAVRVENPVYRASVAVTVAAFAASLLGLWIGALAAGVDLARATAAVGGFATSWFAVILAVAAFVAAWCGIALVRTRAARPRWPWERDEDDPAGR